MTPKHCSGLIGHPTGGRRGNDAVAAEPWCGLVEDIESAGL